MNDMFYRLRLDRQERKTVRNLVHKGWLITPPEGHSKYGCLICDECAEKLRAKGEKQGYDRGYWHGYRVALIGFFAGQVLAIVLGEMLFK